MTPALALLSNAFADQQGDKEQPTGGCILKLGPSAHSIFNSFDNLQDLMPRKLSSVVVVGGMAAGLQGSERISDRDEFGRYRIPAKRRYQTLGQGSAGERRTRLLHCGVIERPCREVP
jgi:hypothetical protein